MKIVLQDGYKDCGICCLLSIIRFYGGEVSKEYLRELTNTTKDGVTLYDLSYAATKIGFTSQGVTGKIDKLELKNLPCIAHINVNKRMKHFIVIYNLDFEIIFITYLIYKKIYTYEKLSGIVMKNNIVLLVIDNDQKKDLYKNKYIYYKDKKTSYKIIKNNGVIITKGDKKYYEVMIKISIKSNKKSNDSIDFTLKKTKINSIKIFNLILDGDLK